MHRQNFHYNAGQQPSNEQAIAAAMMENDAAALAAEMFDHFCSAVTLRQILGLFRNMCDTVGIRPAPINEFYPKLKAKIKNWKAQALWKKFDARLSHRVYNKGTACTGTRVLVIGGGPCGLRTAIEAQFLGAKVVVVEKRDRITRNNVLHLWPFLIHDLRSLGAKKFYGKFCAGSIDHISIRQLQCILLKVALLLGVEVHEGVSFEGIIEPSDGCGWRVKTEPHDHAVSHFEFDALIGADGKRNTLGGFNRKEFRGKLAIAITANFINRRTEDEARVEEISGVAFIFNQSFFKELYHQTGIDLENIVYYKDETHYFVMTAKKHSLLDKGVIIQDFSDPAELLHPNNVNTIKLQDYAREAADFSTKYQMPCLEFAVNHYGKPDVAMFDFTSMFAAENSSRIVVRKNYRLLMCIVGDSLLEPFWPSGSGCARGFLSGMDAAYAMKLMANTNNSLLSVLSQRESIYRLLAQTTPENLSRDHSSYTLDPMTRYPNLNRQFVLPHQMKHLLDTDDPTLLELTFMDTNVIQSLPEPTMKTRKRRTADTTPMAHVLLGWIKSHLKEQEFASSIVEPSQIFTHGKVLCALIHRYRPDLCDWNSIENTTAEESNEIAFSVFETEFKLPRAMSADESLTLENIDIKVWLHYLEQICEVFRGEIPHVKHPKLDYAEFKQKNQTQTNKMADFAKLHKLAVARREAAKEDNGSNNARRTHKLPTSPTLQNVEHRRGRKRRSYEKYGGNIEERMARLADIDANRIDRQARRRQQRKLQTENFLKSLHMLQAANYLRENDGDDSAAFEDYSIFMYRQNAPEFSDRVKELEKKLLYPDRERGIQSALPRTGVLDDQFSDRIRNIEEKFTTKNAAATNKKPKDLLRAIGKIESNDWNVKEIEKKMEMSKKIHDVGKSREKVPKWNRDQFLARQNKMQKPDRQDSTDLKYKGIDETIKALDKQLKEGSTLDRGERGRNKVAAIAASTFGKKKEEENSQTAQKAGLILSSQGISEACHFCKQRVYLMEKINAEGLILHRSCLKCHHCHTNLRLGGYAFDRENPDGKFYCTQHFKLPPKDSKFVPKRLQHKQRQADYVAFKAQHQQKQQSPSQDKKRNEGDMLDNRGKTPERIEFEAGISDGEPVEDQIMDENEWTDLNFGTGDEDSVDEESSSDETESESDSEIFEDPIGVDAQTLQLASEWIDKRSTLQDSEDEFYGYSSEDDDADSQTEGEELAKAREMRMNEVKLLPPPTYILTDTETEGVKNSMTQNIENINNKISDNNLVSYNTPPINPPTSQFNNPKDELLKHDMMKKLSLKEKWLNDNQAAAAAAAAAASIPPSPPAIVPKAIPMEIDEHVNDGKKKEEKKSFFNGIFTSVKHFIKNEKHDKDHDKMKSKSSPPRNDKIDIDNFDELLKESEEPPAGNVSRKIQKFLQKQKSSEIRDEADDILNDIKEEKDRLDKHMRDMEQRRFSENMQAIKSSVAESKVASMKERNLSKYFPKQQDKKPPAIAKNRDVKALKDVNLSKYFPSQTSPTMAKRNSGSPAELSGASSANHSPLTPRKDVNEIDLGNYFPTTPTISRKTSTNTPPSSPLTENSPALTRKDSITRIVIASPIPANPPPPAPKKNVLSLQTVKKRQPSPGGNDRKENVIQKQEPSNEPFILEKPKERKKKNDFNMFDQLLDGAIDLDLTKDLDADNFDSLIKEVKLERSPSKEYDKIFDISPSKSGSGSKEISPEKPTQNVVTEIEQKIDELKEKKAKRKSSKKTKKDVLDKLDIDPKFLQSLGKEYQRLLEELERSSKSPESDEFEMRNASIEVQKSDESLSMLDDSDGLIENVKLNELSPERCNRLDNKRKSPQRYDDCKKFKENEMKIDGKSSDTVKIENQHEIIIKHEKNDEKVSNLIGYENKAVKAEHKIDAEQSVNDILIEEESIISRLERKYRRSSLKSNAIENVDETSDILDSNKTSNVDCVNKTNEASDTDVISKNKADEEVHISKAVEFDKNNEQKPLSVIERLEQKLRQRKSIDYSQETESPIDIEMKESLPLEFMQKNENLRKKDSNIADFVKEAKNLIEKEKNEAIRDSSFLESVFLVKEQLQKQENVVITKQQDEKPLVIEGASKILLQKPPIPIQNPKNSHKIEPLKNNKNKPEINYFENILSLPKENIDDILSEFELNEKETERALKEFHENFELLTKDETEIEYVKVDVVDIDKMLNSSENKTSKTSTDDMKIVKNDEIFKEETKETKKDNKKSKDYGNSKIPNKNEEKIMKMPNNKNKSKNTETIHSPKNEHKIIISQNQEKIPKISETKKSKKSKDEDKNPQYDAKNNKNFKDLKDSDSLYEKDEHKVLYDSDKKIPQISETKKNKKPKDEGKIAQYETKNNKKPKEEEKKNKKIVAEEEKNKKPNEKLKQQDEKNTKPNEVKHESKDEKQQEPQKEERRRSLQIDLVEIESGISERPLNIENLFGTRKFDDNLDNANIVSSEKHKNYQGDSRNYSEEERNYASAERKLPAQELKFRTKEFKLPQQEGKEEAITDSYNKQKESNATASHTNYLNILKEISNELIGFDEEPLLFVNADIKPHTAKVNVNKESSLIKDKINESYANVLQDISSNLVGADLYQAKTTEKNYSQIIPPNVQDLKSMVESSDVLQVPNYQMPRNRLREFDSSENDIIEFPVPPPRRHKSAEHHKTPESLYDRDRKFLSPTRSIDYDTISGFSSTEYFDHYYSVAHNNLSQLDKYDLNTNTNASTLSKNITAEKPKARTYDDISVKYPKHVEEQPRPKRNQTYHHHDESNFDSKQLFEKSKALRRRKEDFMRDQVNESNNPYIREMMRQDVDNPLDRRDFKFIRKHPTVPLPSSNLPLSSYQPRTVSSPVTSPRTQISYGRTSSITTPSYSRPSSTSYKASTYVPSTSSHIYTKSHTLTPPSNYGSYSSRNRAVTSFSDPMTTSSSRVTSRVPNYSSKKSTASRDACNIS